MNKFKPGQLVISKSGRDKGRMFLVSAVLDEQFVSLVDGKLRRLEKPKRKKIIHLQATNYHSDVLQEPLVNDAQVRKTIQKYQPTQEEVEFG